MTKVLTVFRLLLLLLAMGGLGAWCVWKWAPHQIQGVEAVAIKCFMHSAERGLSHAQELSKAGDWEGAAGVLEGQVMSLKGSRKLDRLFRLRRKAIQQLAVATAKIGDPLRASEAVGKFLRDDPKDLPLAIQWADLLLTADSVEANASGRKQYSELFAWLPLVSSIAKGHIRQLSIHGEPDELEEGLAEHLKGVERPAQVMQNLHLGWFYRYGADADLSKVSKSPINVLREGGDLVLPFKVPAGSRFLRIDFPSYSVAELSSARIEVGSDSFLLGKPTITTRLEWRKEQLSANGRASAWAVYPIPELVGKKDLEGVLRFELTALPSWLEPHLGGAVGRALQKRCIEQGERKKYALLREAWIRRREKTPIRVRGAEGTPVFQHPLRKVGMAVEFDCEVTFAPSTSEFVVVLPLVAGDILSLERFHLYSGSEVAQSVVGGETKGIVMDGIEWLYGKGKIVKDRPQMRWRTTGSTSIDRVELRGQVK
ncbi:MAG: hypothetical protein GY924_14740 [Planctomycetaceae bacterium]|nr:hypothetical protein [Planctomycetaceae bacterium]